MQAIVILFYFLTMDALLTPKNAIFAVLGVAWLERLRWTPNVRQPEPHLKVRLPAELGVQG